MDNDSKRLDFSVTTTARGCAVIEFQDRYGVECSIQKSSLATEDAIWLGPSEPNPKILHGDAKRFGIETKADCGWVSYPLPEEVQCTTRMHLTRTQVAELLPVLRRFADTGELLPPSHEARAALAQPEPPADGEVAELVAALEADAECVEVEHYDLCNMTAEQMRRAATLLQRLSAITTEDLKK